MKVSTKFLRVSTKLKFVSTKFGKVSTKQDIDRCREVSAGECVYEVSKLSTKEVKWLLIKVAVVPLFDAKLKVSTKF